MFPRHSHPCLRAWVSVGSVTRIGDQCGRIGRPGSVTTKHGSVTGSDGSVARSPGSVTEGIAKKSETKKADHTGSVARIRHQIYRSREGKENKPSQTQRIGHQDRSPERCRRGVATEKKKKQNNCAGSYGESRLFSSNFLNSRNGLLARKTAEKYQPHRIGRQDRSPSNYISWETEEKIPTTPDRSPGSVTTEVLCKTQIYLNNFCCLVGVHNKYQAYWILYRRSKISALGF